MHNKSRNIICNTIWGLQKKIKVNVSVVRGKRKGKEEKREREANFIEINSRYQAFESRIFKLNDFHPNR